jgi:hypothetical protein
MASLKDRLKELDRLKKSRTITADEYQTGRAAALSDTSSLPDKGRGDGIFKWGLLGCLGVFAVVAILVVGLIVIVVIVVTGVGSAGTDLKDVHVSYAEGSSGTVTTAANVKNHVTITKITDPAQSTNPLEQPAAGKHYMSIAVTIQNVGISETTGGDFKLRGTDGTEYDNTFVSGVGTSDLAFLKGITSGGRTDAVIAFEVADGQKVQWLKFDPNLFAKGDLYFDAK